MSGEPLDPLQLDLLAASLRADAADAVMWMRVLGTKLAATLPARVTLHRGGMLHQGSVDALAVDLGTWRFALRSDRGQPIAERTHLVRGIALKTETLPLDLWLAALTEALAELAATGERERRAILQLLE